MQKLLDARPYTTTKTSTAALGGGNHGQASQFLQPGGVRKRFLACADDVPFRKGQQGRGVAATHRADGGKQTLADVSIGAASNSSLRANEPKIPMEVTY